jgi:UDP-glucose 4-epimerase
MDKDFKHLIKRENIEFARIDLTKADELSRVEMDFECVYHLAAINGTRFFYEIPEKVLEVNVKCLINVLEASVAAGVKRFIFPSSSEVYSKPDTIPTPETERVLIPDITNPRSSYAGSKIVGELFCLNYGKKHGIEPIILRYFNVYGPRMGAEHVIPEVILRMKKISEGFRKKNFDFQILGAGKETRAFCYIADAIEGTVIAAEDGKASEIYNVGNDQEEIEIRQLVNMIARILGVNISIKPGPARVGGPTKRCPNIDKLRKLGYEPKVKLEQGLKETIKWYLNNYR